MSIVNTTQPITSASCQQAISELTQTYPFCRSQLLTTTAFQRPIYAMQIGEGKRKVMYSAAHHANEWITSLILLQFAQDLAQAIQTGEPLLGRDIRQLVRETSFYLIPMVDPDGVDLVTGAIAPTDSQYALARGISQNYPDIPFPEGWKANLLGVDLNLNYPARWLTAREIKFSQGFVSPAPRDFVGRAPLNQAETQAMADYTFAIDPDLVLAFHTQGKEIYWQFDDIAIPGAKELGQKMADASGYNLADTPYNSSFAGYKDWFIQRFRRPGYTIEAGSGENPLPLSQFDRIYQECLPIMLIAAEG